MTNKNLFPQRAVAILWAISGVAFAGYIAYVHGFEKPMPIASRPPNVGCQNQTSPIVR